MDKIEIKEFGADHMEARGFLLNTGSDEWVLYPEPALQSCCHAGDLKMGLPLAGKIPTQCKGQCITVQGLLEGQQFQVTSTSASSSPLWIILILIALPAFFCFLRKPR